MKHILNWAVFILVIAWNIPVLLFTVLISIWEWKKGNERFDKVFNDIADAAENCIF